MKLQSAIQSLGPMSAAVLLMNCSSESGRSEDSGTDRLVPAVEAVQARYGALPLTERLSGVVKAVNQIEIYPEIDAAIVEMLAENGEVVKRGQPLIRLRDSEFLERLKQARAGYQIAVAQAQQAEAQLKEIQAELDRTEALAEKDLVSATELETIRTRAISAEADVELAKARVDQAQATVDEREVVLSHTVIRAPVAGTVGNRNAEVGMLVSSSTRLLTLGQLDNVRVQVVLTDRMLNYIEAGQRTEIYAENVPANAVTASLSRISPFLHPVTHSTDAEIDLANPDGRLKPGRFVAVEVYYGESEQATLVPLSALYENPVTGATGVYVCQDSLDREPMGTMTGDQAGMLTAPVRFEFVPVEVIAKGRMEAGVRGVAPGSWVVTIGKDLFGGESGTARVRPVHWKWVQQLQHLQREDLLREVLKRQQEAAGDSALQRDAV